MATSAVTLQAPARLTLLDNVGALAPMERKVVTLDITGQYFSKEVDHLKLVCAEELSVDEWSF